MKFKTLSNNSKSTESNYNKTIHEQIHMKLPAEWNIEFILQKQMFKEPTIPIINLMTEVYIFLQLRKLWLYMVVNVYKKIKQ